MAPQIPISKRHNTPPPPSWTGQYVETVDVPEDLTERLVRVETTLGTVVSSLKFIGGLLLTQTIGGIVAAISWYLVHHP